MHFFLSHLCAVYTVHIFVCLVLYGPFFGGDLDIAGQKQNTMLNTIKKFELKTNEFCTELFSKCALLHRTHKPED